MKNQNRSYVSVEKLTGPIDMNYDWQLAEQEAMRRAGINYHSLQIQTPAQIERRAEQAFEKGLAAIKS
jgi:hypothetical protein